MFALADTGLDGLRDAVDALVAAEDGAVDVVALRREIDRLEHVLLRGVADADRRAQWQDEGFLSTAAWLREKCRLDHGVATRTVVTAQRLESLPKLAAAFADGDVSRGHVERITEACTPDRIDAIVEVDSELADAARLAKPSELGKIVARLTDALDGDGGAAADEARYERRRLHVTPGFDRMAHIDGRGDLDGGERVATALSSFMDRDLQPGDRRTTPQRRWDALVAICDLVLGNGLGGSRAERPHVSVVVDLTELEERAPAAVKHARADALHMGRLSRTTLEMLTCDCKISRVITDGPSDVLDVGRLQRTVTPAQWRALVARDRHCQAPGCDRGPERCDAHHIVHWLHGGSTSLSNLQLLCHAHHRQHHLQITHRRRE
jgi:hypothetical protein